MLASVLILTPLLCSMKNRERGKNGGESNNGIK